ncbi:tetratricopeptide repeat protein, partial [Balneolaceae bacterium ANBcel3]|nr:tetratricopeptide repeat protein [Balneolaceae bacterium ANBcel3]
LNRYSNEPDNEPLRLTTEMLIVTLLDSEPDHGLSHALAAEFYMLQDDYTKAIELLHQTVHYMPQNEAAWRQLVQNYYIKGLHEDVIHYGEKANEQVPDDAFIHFFVGSAYFLLDNHTTAVKWLESASELPARSLFRSIILGTMGDIYATIDEWSKAVDAYESALEMNPENDVVLNNYAYYLSEREEQLDKAREMAVKALELSPDNAAFLDTMGWIYFKLEEYEKAHRYIRKSLETGDASAEVMEHMGDVYDKLGEPDKALYWWKKALDKDEERDHLKERLHIN